MRTSGWVLPWLALITACLDTSLPPPPGAGTVSGTVVRAVAGWSQPRPVAGARLELLGTSVSAVTNDEGFFLLEGVSRPGGQLLVTLDLEADGVVDAQRLLDLAPFKVGPGRDVALGEVVVGRAGRLWGEARTLAQAEAPSGHGGTSVFIKGTSAFSFTADDGSFELDALPEGRLEVLIFRDGFEPVVLPVDLAAGEERQLERVLLAPATDSRPAAPGGRIVDELGPVAAARIRLVGVATSSEGTSGADGAWTVTPLPAGLYNLGVEAEGHRPALLRGVLLVPGPQALTEILLQRGAGEPLVIPPPPSAGLDGGPDCGGACSPGFTCSARSACETAACELVSCTGACARGLCFAPTCPGADCSSGEVCDDGRCVSLACAGVRCPASSACAQGRCVPTLCAAGPCPTGQVCDGDRCADARCVDVDCGPGRSCFAGHCFPSTVGATSCAAGAVQLGGRCVDLRCEGVSCPAGSFCQAGACTASGLFAAGTLLASGRGAAETIIAGSGPDGWRRLNVTTLPRVIQLLISRDGQWLFAHTDDSTDLPQQGSVWRSTDGRTWLLSWAGDAANAGTVTAVAIDHRTGRLTASLAGGPNGLSSGVIVSDDDGATWSTQWRSPLINGVIRDRITGVSPDWAVISFSNFGGAGVYPLDGGAKLSWFSTADTLLLSDPKGVGPTYLAGDQLFGLDGGLLGPMRAACQGCVLYGEGSSSAVHVAAASALWFSAGGQGPWGLRTLPTMATPSLRAPARAADGVLYLANEGAGGPALLSSTDDGVTWGAASEPWRVDLALSDPYPAWQPDAGYPYDTRVRPTVPNGFAYACGPGNCASGDVEPAWKTDGGVTPDRVGQWNALPVSAARLSALVSRACGVGQQRCGGSCVSVVSDAANCGACGVQCAGACVLGRCVGGADAGTASGCADGTREGFLDETAWPSLAACAGRWAGALSAASGDPLCGAGFHVCTEQDDELRAVRLADALSFPGCFAYRASNDGFDGCEPLECTAPTTRDDMAGLGRGCRLLSGVQHAGDGGATSCLGDGARLDAECCQGAARGTACRQAAQAGVVCCRD